MELDYQLLQFAKYYYPAFLQLSLKVAPLQLLILSCIIVTALFHVILNFNGDGIAIASSYMGIARVGSSHSAARDIFTKKLKSANHTTTKI